MIREERFTTSGIRLVKRKDEILALYPYPGMRFISLEELEECYEIFMKMQQGATSPFFSDNTSLEKVGSAEKKFISETFHHFATSAAILGNSAVLMAIHNTIVRFFPPRIPMKMFSSEQQAFDWLIEQKEIKIIATKYTSNAIICKREDGILTFQHLPGIKSISMDELIENFTGLKEVQKGEKSPMLLDTKGVNSNPTEHKTFTSKNVPEIANALAILVEKYNPVARFTVNVFMQITRPSIPTKAFDDRGKAIQWLKGYL